MMAYVAGFGGGRERGIQMLQRDRRLDPVRGRPRLADAVSNAGTTRDRRACSR